MRGCRAETGAGRIRTSLQHFPGRVVPAPSPHGIQSLWTSPERWVGFLNPWPQGLTSGAQLRARSGQSGCAAKRQGDGTGGLHSA